MSGWNRQDPHFQPLVERLADWINGEKLPWPNAVLLTLTLSGILWTLIWVFLG